MIDLDFLYNLSFTANAFIDENNKIKTFVSSKSLKRNNKPGVPIGINPFPNGYQWIIFEEAFKKYGHNIHKIQKIEELKNVSELVFNVMMIIGIIDCFFRKELKFKLGMCEKSGFFNQNQNPKED